MIAAMIAALAVIMATGSSSFADSTAVVNPTGLSSEVNVGYGYIPANIDSEFFVHGVSVDKKFRAGPDLELEFTYYPTSIFGAGMCLNELGTRASFARVTTDSGTVFRDVTFSNRVWFLGMVARGRQQVNYSGNPTVFAEMGVGYTFFVFDVENFPRVNSLTGSTFGVKFMVGIDWMFTRNFALGVKAGVLPGNCVVTYNDLFNGHIDQLSRTVHLLRYTLNTGVRLCL